MTEKTILMKKKSNPSNTTKTKMLSFRAEIEIYAEVEKASNGNKTEWLKAATLEKLAREKKES